MKAPHAVLFDLDDTLNDRRASVESYAARFAADFRDDLDEADASRLEEKLQRADRAGYNPERAADIARTLRWCRDRCPEELERHWLEHFPTHVVARPGLRELLAELRTRNVRIGLVTNGGVEGQTRKLEVLEIRDSFDAVAISKGVGFEKPDARIFAHVLDELDCTPGESWFVGDHPEKDVDGARRAGMHGIWLRASHAWPAHLAPPETEVASLHEVLSLVRASTAR